MRQVMKQTAGPAFRPATSANDDAPATTHRTARLPGADRRILRKRLAGLAKERAPRVDAVQPA